MVGLADLVPELIQEILDYNDVSHQVLALYSTGSKALQRKLLSIPSISLCNDRGFALPTFPKLVVQLRSLRSFSVVRHGYIILDHPSITEALLGVGQQLFKLVLDFGRASSILATIFRSQSTDIPPLATLASASATGEPSAPLTAAFPALKSLNIADIDLDTIVLLSTHAPSLTHLETNFSREIAVREAFKVLPPSLHRLKLTWREPNFPNLFGHLPRDLQHAELNFASPMNTLYAQDMALLPQTLLTLHLSQSCFLSPETAAALPRSITSLSDFYVRQEEETLRALPPSLKRFVSNNRLRISYPLLQDLPRTLQTLGKLTVAKTDSRDQVVAFPPDLTDLNLVIATTALPTIWASLPSKLTKLNLSHNSKKLSRKAIAALPRSLLDLEAVVGEIWDAKRIPFDWPNLHTLVVHGALTSFEGDPSLGKVRSSLLHHTLPNSITSLAVHSVLVPSSALRFLPDHLQELHIGWISDAEWQPESQIMKDRARYLLELGLKSDRLDESERAEYLSSIGLDFVDEFDMLPRTIVRLEIETDLSQTTGEAWKRLPKFLRFLGFPPSSVFNPETFLDNAPISHLLEASFNLQSLTTAQARRLPRTLRRGLIGGPSSEFSLETARAVPHGDPGKLYFPFDEWHDLWRKRSEAIEKHDVPALQALLLP